MALHARCDGPRPERTGESPRPRVAGGPAITLKIAEGSELEIIVPGPASVLAIEPAAPAALGHLEEGAILARAEGGSIRLGEILAPGPLEVLLDSDSDSGPANGGSGKGGDLAFVDRTRPLPGNRRAFRGSFVLSVSGDRLLLTNRVALEEYLAGVVGSEMPASAYPMEALKAQAVASRTYALYGILRAEERGRRRPFAADQQFQVYGGKEREHRRVLEAVSATAGEVLFFREALFRSYFHACCGGRTADAVRLFGEPAIEPLLGTGCGACDGSRRSRWTARIEPGEIERALMPWATARGVAPGAVKGLEVSERAEDGRASWVRVLHEGGSFEVHAETLRALLGKAGQPIRSASFDVSEEGGAFHFAGRGHGHGAGLCQVGAAGKAEASGYREILAGYFPGSRVETVY